MLRQWHRCRLLAATFSPPRPRPSPLSLQLPHSSSTSSTTLQQLDILPMPKQKLQPCSEPLTLPVAAEFFSLPPITTPPLLLALDIEAWEQRQSIVTEIGFSALDPSLSPWSAHVKSTHILIAEHTDKVNGKYVAGCPQNFLFGKTETLPLAQAIDRVKTALQLQPTATSSEHAFLSPKKTNATTVKPREVILVGHGVRGDMTYLSRLGVDTSHLRIIDTQRLAGAKKNPIGLKRLLDAVGVEYSYLHNAGNDAAFTMKALARMVEEYAAHGEAWKATLKLLPGQEGVLPGQGDKKAWRKRKANAMEAGTGGDEKLAVVVVDTKAAASIHADAAKHGQDKDDEDDDDDDDDAHEAKRRKKLSN